LFCISAFNRFALFSDKPAAAAVPVNKKCRRQQVKDWAALFKRLNAHECWNAIPMPRFASYCTACTAKVTESQSWSESSGPVTDLGSAVP